MYYGSDVGDLLSPSWTASVSPDQLKSNLDGSSELSGVLRILWPS